MFMPEPYTPCQESALTVRRAVWGRSGRGTCGKWRKAGARLDRRGRRAAGLCETSLVAAILGLCGATAVIVGAWRGYAVAREAIAPLAHAGEPTRTAIEATRPLLARSRVRLFVRRLAASLGWIAIALYGLFLVSVGLEVGR